MKITDCKLLEFPKIADARGNLSFVENERHIPFDIKRLFYLYQVPAGEKRAGHALIKCHQCLIPISGSFDVLVDDGAAREQYHLDQPNCGLYVPAMIWRELTEFSAGAVCLVLASEYYNELDYYRDYAAFQKAAKGKGK